ncbi:MAG: hypothetical protein ACPG20_02205 [Pontimonas sp.]
MPKGKHAPPVALNCPASSPILLNVPSAMGAGSTADLIHGSYQANPTFVASRVMTR